MLRGEGRRCCALSRRGGRRARGGGVGVIVLVVMRGRVRGRGARVAVPLGLGMKMRSMLEWVGGEGVCVVSSCGLAGVVHRDSGTGALRRMYF